MCLNCQDVFFIGDLAGYLILGYFGLEYFVLSCTHNKSIFLCLLHSKEESGATPAVHPIEMAYMPSFAYLNYI